MIPFKLVTPKKATCTTLMMVLSGKMLRRLRIGVAIEQRWKPILDRSTVFPVTKFTHHA